MTIGQLSRKTGYSKDTIRYYEKIGLIKPSMYRRHANGYKDYHESIVGLLEMVSLAKQHGFTLPEMKNYLARQGNVSLNCALIAPLLLGKLQEIDRRIEALRHQREILLEGIQRLEREC